MDVTTTHIAVPNITIFYGCIYHNYVFGNHIVFSVYVIVVIIYKAFLSAPALHRMLGNTWQWTLSFRYVLILAQMGRSFLINFSLIIAKIAKWYRIFLFSLTLLSACERWYNYYQSPCIHIFALYFFLILIKLFTIIHIISKNYLHLFSSYFLNLISNDK